MSKSEEDLSWLDNDMPPKVKKEGPAKSSKNITEVIKDSKKPVSPGKQFFIKQMEEYMVKRDQELLDLKKRFQKLLQAFQDHLDNPQPEVYNALWIMCRSFQSQYKNKGDSMLAQLAIVMKQFNINLLKNPFDKIKEVKQTNE